MLYTNLKHIETAELHAQIISDHANVVIICGKMEPKCISVYRVIEKIEEDFSNVKFYDMEFTNPESHVIRNLPEVNGFVESPFSIYYKAGKVVKATSGIQSLNQMTKILINEFELSLSV